jgi:hypothetical protein
MEFTSDQIREAVFDHIREVHARRTKPGLVTRLAMFLAEKKPIESLIITEREFGNQDRHSHLCTGAVLRAWTLDANGLKPLDPTEAKPLVAKGRYWPRGLVEFHIPSNGLVEFHIPSNGGVIVNDMEGPRKGLLYLLYLKDRRMRRGKLMLRMLFARQVDAHKNKRGAHGGPP